MANNRKGRRWRRWLLWIVLIGFVVLVASRFTSLQHLTETLSMAQWQWLLVAVAVDIVYFVLYALLYQLGFHTVEVKSRITELLPVLFASIFVSSVAPVGGLGAAALFVDNAIQNGQSGARAAAGTVLVLVIDLSTSMVYIILGMLFLSAHHELRFYYTAGTVIYFLFAAILTSALLLAWWRAKALYRVFVWLQRTTNQVGLWFRRPGLLSDDWADRNSWQFTDAAITIAQYPKQLGMALALGLCLHAINIVGLWALFPAFQQPVKVGLTVAAFGMGRVFFVISFLPHGVGSVEGIMALVFTSLGIASSKAVAIVLSYRGLNFWLPLLLGIFLLERVSSFGAKNVTEMRPENDSPPDDESHQPP